MAKMRMDFEAKDNASETIKKIVKNTVDGAQKIAGSDKAISSATKEASRVKMEALTLSQKMKFAIAKEAAAGDKYQVNLVNQKEKLAKLERQLRSAIKHGDDNSQAVAKQVAEQRKHVKTLEDDTKAQKDNNETKAISRKQLLAIAAAATAAAAATFLLAKRTAEMGDDMIKSAQRLGLTVGEYQRLGHAMVITGTSIEEQRGSLVRFARTARDASSGVKIAKEAFDRLGVTVKDSQGNYKGTNDLLLEVADNFRKMPQSVEKTALAMDLFGRSGTALSQFLNLGTAGIVELGDEAEALGGVMTKLSAQQGEEFVDAFARMEVAVGGVARTMGEEFQPVYTRAMEAAAKTTATASKSWKEYIDTFKPFAQWLTDSFVFVFKWVGKAMVGAATSALLAWEGVKIAVNGILGGIVGGLKSVSAKMREMAGLKPFPDDGFNPFISSAKEALGSANKLISAANDTLTGLDNIAAAATDWGDVQRELTTPATNEATAALKQNAAAIKEVAAARKAQEKEEKEAQKRQASALDRFVSNRAKAREANLKLHEDMIKQVESEQLALMNFGTRTAESLGASMGTALARVVDGTAEVKDVFKAMAQSSIRAIQSVVMELIKEAAVQAAVKGAIFGPVAATAAAAATFAMLSGLVSNFHEGGVVPGSGNRDTVPAMLTPGELVLPKEMASDLLRVAGKTSTGQFAEGGRVGRGGGGVVVNFHEGIMPRSPAELDRYVRDKLAPSLQRLKRQGAIA